MPAEVAFPDQLVVSTPFDVVNGYNPIFALGYVNVRNPGAAPVSGTLVAVDRNSGRPVASDTFNLAPGEGHEWALGGLGQVVNVVLQAASGPVSVSWKVGTR